jgi:hypothetical protein
MSYLLTTSVPRAPSASDPSVAHWNTQFLPRRNAWKAMRRTIISASSVLLFAFTVQAQSFSSGSTGSDGALDLTSGDQVVQLPESGVLNYTTVSVPAGRTLTFRRNLRNTTVTMLAQGAVSIEGRIDVSAVGQNYGPFCGFTGIRAPGPGGFYGGQVNQPGFGPGAGATPSGFGSWIGPLSLVPIVGGSGGAGDPGALGGCGGGAIVIASSVSITQHQTHPSHSGIYANGAADYACGGGGFYFVGGSGAGGAIRLVANAININGKLSACNVNNTNCGVIRLEAPSGSLVFTGSSNPPAGLFPINPTVLPSTAPSLTIVSIAGFPVPSYAGSRFDTYDMLLPNQLADPVSMVVHAVNIPVGTQVIVGFVNGSPNATSTPGTLSGTLQSSSATATISALNRTAVTYLLATAIFDPPATAMKFNAKGPNEVAKVRIIALPGAKPRFVFLRGNGTEVDLAKVPKPFLAELGL